MGGVKRMSLGGVNKGRWECWSALAKQAPQPMRSMGWGRESPWRTPLLDPAHPSTPNPNGTDTWEPPLSRGPPSICSASSTFCRHTHT